MYLGVGNTWHKRERGTKTKFVGESIIQELWTFFQRVNLGLGEKSVPVPGRHVNLGNSKRKENG